MSGYDITLDRKKTEPLNIMLNNILPNSRVLEFGCANGRMTQYMQQSLNCKVDIVEYDEDLFCKAKVFAERGICGDILEFKWADAFADEQYDYIIFADVLEHLSDPKRVLEKCYPLLNDTGLIWVSVPNIAHNDIILNLLDDKFNYTETGLLDNTHIHFFTKQSAECMFQNAKYHVLYRDGIFKQTLCSEQLLLEDVNTESWLEDITKRDYGDIYQCIFALSKKDTTSHQLPTDYYYYDKEKGLYERRIFFDCGEGYHSSIFTAEKCDDTQLDIGIALPENIQTVWVCPAFRKPFIIQDLKIWADDEQIDYCHISAEHHDNKYYFKSFEGGIYVNELQGKTSLKIEGQIFVDVSFGKIQQIAEQEQLEQAQKEIIAKEKQLALATETNQQLLAKEKEYKEIIDNMNQTLEEKKQTLAKKEQENEALISQLDRMVQLQESELRAVNEQLKAMQDNMAMLRQYEETIFNTQHTVNDILYVAQNSGWYKRAMKRIQKRKVSDVVSSGTNKLYNISYRVAKKSPGLYKVMRKFFFGLSKISPKMRNHMERHIWRAKEEIDHISLQNNAVQEGTEINWVDQCDMQMPQGTPLVSVIVPNYNHAPYLKERLDSIYAQTYTNYEVILLDDCSKDNSREILQEYAALHPENTVCDFNEANVGRANLQWNKGLARAKGKYIWIAESDDWCESDFLEKLVPMLEQQSVMIAFARSVFMTDGKKTWSTEEYLYDIDIRWDKPFTMTGYEAVRRGFAIKNVIPNVSSALFRNIGKIPDEVMNIWENIRLSGDWIFYLYLVKGGALAYTNETTNYYRIHSGSTSLKVQKTAEYYHETETVSRYIAQNFNVPMTIFENTLKTLQSHYINNGFGTNPDDILQWYHLEEIQKAAAKRIPNTLICNFSMKMGGGEILPIHLANALRKKGAPVTFVDCRMEEYDEKVRSMLDAGVPLVELKTPLALKIVADIFGCEIVHSHHGCVDKLISELLKDYDCNQVITLHGMYEAIELKDRIDLLQHVSKTCKVFAYIAEKNLVPFKENGYFEKCNFIKIGNGLVSGAPTPIERASLNIPHDAFVLCLVSRARLDKGWLEAVDAVIKANTLSQREIHLVLVGDGEAYEQVSKVNSPFIHAVGAQQNPRAYFAAADMGFLPSRFAGESFPLVVIESLMCDKPVLATNIGEIPNQLTLDTGARAGILFDLENGTIPIDSLAQTIAEIAKDESKYQELKANVPAAASKFDIDTIADQYIGIYKTAMK